eukprot:scaffold291253_cov31-Tisochrysis_lutea.AAC.3
MSCTARGSWPHWAGATCGTVTCAPESTAPSISPITVVVSLAAAAVSSTVTDALASVLWGGGGGAPLESLTSRAASRARWSTISRRAAPAEKVEKKRCRSASLKPWTMAGARVPG